MDPLVRRKSITAFFILLALSVAGIWVLVIVWYELLYFSHIRRETLVLEIQELVQEPLESITVLPDEPWSGEDFKYQATDRKELDAFAAAARMVDMKRVSDQSQAVFEVIVLLRTRGSAMKYTASVHELEPEDLFISNGFWRNLGEGSYQRDAREEVRIPGLGLWMMRFAPEGCSPSIRAICRSGELAIDFVNPYWPLDEGGTEQLVHP